MRDTCKHTPMPISTIFGYVSLYHASGLSEVKPQRQRPPKLQQRPAVFVQRTHTEALHLLRGFLGRAARPYLCSKSVLHACCTCTEPVGSAATPRHSVLDAPRPHTSRTNGVSVASWGRFDGILLAGASQTSCRGSVEPGMVRHQPNCCLLRTLFVWIFHCVLVWHAFQLCVVSKQFL